MDKYQPTKGTRVMMGEQAQQHNSIIQDMVQVAKHLDFKPIILPTIEPLSLYEDIMGDNRMYEFQDRVYRDLVLRPECTNTISALAEQQNWPTTRVFYVQQCFRYDNPQLGRWREFTQFGMETLNPISRPVEENYLMTAINLIFRSIPDIPIVKVENEVDRGASYYERGAGFEGHIHELGTASQVLGGGHYRNGVGFAIGVDRIALAQGIKKC